MGKNVKHCIYPKLLYFMIDCVGFNCTSTLVGHFVSPPKEREKRDRRDSIEEMKERDREERGTGMKGGKNRRNQNIPLYPYLLQG